MKKQIRFALHIDEDGASLRARRRPSSAAGAVQSARERGRSSRPAARSDSASASIHAVQALTFDVTDTGPGIEPENLVRIFEAFGQTDAGRAAGGTGLGLTISARLVRAMDGELRVDSALGRGSRFYFSLPLTLAGEAPSSAVADDGLTIDARLAPGVTLTALVADDNVINRRVLASILESAGARVITAAGGLEAVELATRLTPDVVLIDRRMADLDGFEATRRISRASGDRAHPGDRRHRQRIRRGPRCRTRGGLHRLRAEADSRRGAVLERWSVTWVRFVARRSPVPVRGVDDLSLGGPAAGCQGCASRHDRQHLGPARDRSGVRRRGPAASAPGTPHRPAGDEFEFDAILRLASGCAGGRLASEACRGNKAR